VFAALCAVESAVAVNPDLRLNAVRDRFYKAIKGTPYFNRRIFIQAVSYDEIVAWCRTFLKVDPVRTLKLSKVTRKAVKDRIQRHIAFIPETVSTFYHGRLSLDLGQRGLLWS
jgi:hypothetical protein